MGAAPTFALKLDIVYKGKKAALTFPRCMSSKLTMAFQNEDHMIPDFDIHAYADDGGLCYSVAFTE